MRIMEYFKIMIERDASDLFLSTCAPPCIKVNGHMLTLSDTCFKVGEVREIAYELMTEEQHDYFETHNDINIGFSQNGLGRFRVNVFMQRNEVSMVVRLLKVEIPSPQEINAPPILTQLIMKKSGLILLTGATGSGKSTTLASIIKYRSENSADHMITIEDPIEFLHKHTATTIINQREIGVDTIDYESALENALRQAPDVVLIGEVRTLKAAEYALRFAETGHLCLTTLHAHNAHQAIERLCHIFPHNRHKQLLLDLSIYLAAIVSQRLVCTKDGKRLAVFEVLLNSPLVSDLIKQGRIDEIKSIMDKSEAIGMQSFDNDLFRLYQDGRITFEEAMQNADSPNNLRIRISLAGTKKDHGDGFSIAGEGYS